MNRNTVQKKEGEMGVRLGLATRDLTPSGDTHEPEVVEGHRVSMTAGCYSIRIPNSLLQELKHLDSNSEQFRIRSLIQVGVNVAHSSKRRILCVSPSGYPWAAASARPVYSV